WHLLKTLKMSESNSQV
ncbi:putative myosin heavy chain domain protein, partial [Chlamydia psittaci 84-8471/1]